MGGLNLSRYAPKPLDLSLRWKHDRRERAKRPWDPSYQKKLNCIELADDFFKNSHGCYRWQHIRQAYFNDFIDIERVVELSNKWKNQTEYLWLEVINKNFPVDSNVVGNLFVKCAKRGNDVYKNRLKERFNFLEDLDPIYYFLDSDKKKFTPMLFVTLTVDPKRYDINSAWSFIANELHVFETKLRQKYGSFVKFRVWESHESGYPHCHVVYFFIDKWFKAIPHVRKGDKKLIYIIPTVHKNSISGFWSMGNVDVQGVQDTHGAFSEVKKYITKNIWSDKGNLTNAMISLYRKQMYSLSRCNPFKKRLWHYSKHGITDWREQERVFMSNLPKWSQKDFIGAIWGTQIFYQFYKERRTLAEPKTTALVRDFLHNCNNEDLEFRYVGCVASMDLATFAPNCSEDWVIIADPPPEFRYLVGFDSDLFSLKEGGSPDYIRSPKRYQCFSCGKIYTSAELQNCNFVGDSFEMFGLCDSSKGGCGRECLFEGLKREVC